MDRISDGITDDDFGAMQENMLRNNRSSDGINGEKSEFLRELDHPDAVRWPVMDERVFRGPLGELARLASANTEADPTAVLATAVVWAGALLGRLYFLGVGDDRHHPRMFITLVGASSRARKGTSTSPVRSVFQEIERILKARPPLRVAHGLSTGEGLIATVRDPRDDEDKGGVEDKRIMVIESEFGRVLRASTRQGNTLSPVLRDAWDGVPLGILTSASPTKATAPHICLLAHVTRDELSKLLDNVDVWNGFANRFLWLCVRRRAEIPLPVGLSDADRSRIANDIASAVEHPHGKDRMVFTEDAKKLWVESYGELTRDHPGILGAVTSRAEAQVLRLAIIYALLKSSDQISADHLEAALAFQRYAFDSARFIFAQAGAAPFDRVAQGIVQALRTGPKTQSELHKHFKGHLKSGALLTALQGLQERGQVTNEILQTGGRPRILWSLRDEKESEFAR